MVSNKDGYKKVGIRFDRSPKLLELQNNICLYSTDSLTLFLPECIQIKQHSNANNQFVYIFTLCSRTFDDLRARGLVILTAVNRSNRISESARQNNAKDHSGFVNDHHSYQTKTLSSVSQIHCLFTNSIRPLFPFLTFC